ncbi:MAG: GldG family protein, partial [Candidatus Eisenbacteria bacterium]
MRGGAIIALGLLLGAVVLAADRSGLRIDLTASGEHALRPATLEVLGRLREPVAAIAFYRPEDPGASLARDLLERFAGASPRFTFSIVDPDRNPGVARNLGVRAYGAIVLEVAGRRETVFARDESEISAALLRLEEEPRAVGFLIGHGERDPAATGEEGCSRAAERLRRGGLRVERLPLSPAGKIPAEIDVIVLAGPVRPLLPGEEEVLDRFVRRGGRLAVLVDPESHLSINALLGRFGVEAGAGVVVDPSSRLYGVDMQVPVVVEYDRHDATRALRGASLFPGARPLLLGSVKAAGELRSLFRTGESAWEETDSLLLAAGKAVFEEGEDRMGPLQLGGVVSVPAEGGGTGRILVVGDSDFASNRFFEVGANGDLFVDLVGWLARDDGPLGIRTGTQESQPLLLSASEADSLTALSLGILPGAYLIAALLVL